MENKLEIDYLLEGDFSSEVAATFNWALDHLRDYLNPEVNLKNKIANSDG